MEIYINRYIFILYYFRDHWNTYGTMKQILESQFREWECSRFWSNLWETRETRARMTLPSKSRSFRELQMVTRCSRFWNKQRTDPRRRWMIKCMRYSCAFESVDSEKKKVNAIIFRRKLFGWNTYLFLYWLENIGLYMQM